MIRCKPPNCPLRSEFIVRPCLAIILVIEVVLQTWINNASANEKNIKCIDKILSNKWRNIRSSVIQREYNVRCGTYVRTSTSQRALHRQWWRLHLREKLSRERRKDNNFQCNQIINITIVTIKGGKRIKRYFVKNFNLHWFFSLQFTTVFSPKFGTVNRYDGILKKLHG